jgi:hypothetical protein
MEYLEGLETMKNPQQKYLQKWNPVYLKHQSSRLAVSKRKQHKLEVV